MAKGLEDTVFYIYNRLAALNEVGGEPQRFGFSVEAFHQRNLRAAARLAGDPARHFHPRHEAQRRCAGADGRDLRNAGTLAQQSLGRWRTSTAAGSGRIDESEAPDANEEYLLYQTLLGTWPVEPCRELSDDGAARITSSRIQAYMAKAMKEAKLNTSWIQPNEHWDAAMRDFVAQDSRSFAARIKFLAEFSSGRGGNRAARRDQFARPNRCSS